MQKVGSRVRQMLPRNEAETCQGGVTNRSVHADVDSTLRRLVALTTPLTSATAAEADVCLSFTRPIDP